MADVFLGARAHGRSDTLVVCRHRLGYDAMRLHHVFTESEMAVYTEYTEQMRALDSEGQQNPGNTTVTFRGERCSNQTHDLTTAPAARSGLTLDLRHECLSVAR